MPANVWSNEALSVLTESVYAQAGVSGRVAPQVVSDSDNIIHLLASGTLGYALTGTTGQLAAGADPLRVPMNLSKVTDGTLQPYALEMYVDRFTQEAASGDGVNLSVIATRWLASTMAIIRERATAAALFNTTTFTGKTTTLSGTDLWSNDESNPVRDIVDACRTAAARSGRRMSDMTMLVGGTPWGHLCKHPMFRDIAKRHGAEYRGVLTEAEIATVCGIKEVIAADQAYETAAEGATSSIGYVWGNYALALAVDAAPNPESGRGCAYTVVRNFGMGGDDPVTFQTKAYTEKGDLRQVYQTLAKWLISVSSTYGQLVSVL